MLILKKEKKDNIELLSNIDFHSEITFSYLNKFTKRYTHISK